MPVPLSVLNSIFGNESSLKRNEFFVHIMHVLGRFDELLPV